MTTIYELKKEQELALEELAWAEDDEEIHAVLNRIDGDVKRKLEFLTTLLAEAITHYDISKEALRSAKERLERNHKRNERTVEKLREFILSICVDFNIPKFKGSLLSVSHGLTPGALVFSDDFDESLLPNDLVDYIPEHFEPNKKALTEKLRASIYDKDLKKLSPTAQYAELRSLPGVILERKESLRVS